MESDPVKIMENPKYSLLERWTLDLSFTSLPLDAFYKPFLAELGTSYQFNDYFSWDVVRFGLNLSSFDTGLKSEIERETTNKASADGTRRVVTLDPMSIKDLRFRISSHGYANVLYSKSNLFNKKIVYHQWQLGGGLSYYDMDSERQTALDLALRVRFFIDNKWIMNLHGGHSIGFQSKAPKNIMFLGLGIGYAF